VTLRSPGADAGEKVELPLPFALAPGHYAADVRTGRKGRRVRFVAGEGGEVVVDA
jgi:hypothetical protein